MFSGSVANGGGAGRRAPIRARASREERWRALLLASLTLGAGGLLVELLLLEHWIVPLQRTPLALLASVLAAAGAMAVRPTGTAVTAFRLVMIGTVAAGAVGIALHFRDNFAFEREIAPDAAVGPTIWEALRGATPLLAPGSLAFMGLVGLVLTYRHPLDDREVHRGDDAHDAHNDHHDHHDHEEEHR